MAKCWQCGKSGMFVQVGKFGLCVDCLEAASDTAIKLINMIKAGGDQRKEALAILDGQEAQDVADQAREALESSRFSEWDVSIHADPAQLDRIRRSSSVKILSYDDATGTAEVKGSGASPYITSFSSCTCGDFRARHLPCKHMYKLAAQYGGVDFSQFIKK